MKREMLWSTILVAAVGATLATSKTAGANGWVGSGWFPLYTSQTFSVNGTTDGGTYTVGFYGTSGATWSWNVTGGGPGGFTTCDAASLLCANYDIIISPYLCESLPGNPVTYVTSTATVNNGNNAGQYYRYSNNQYYAAADTGGCPAPYQGAWEGAFIFQP